MHQCVITATQGQSEARLGPTTDYLHLLQDRSQGRVELVRVGLSAVHTESNSIAEIVQFVSLIAPYT